MHPRRLRPLPLLLLALVVGLGHAFLFRVPAHPVATSGVAATSTARSSSSHLLSPRSPALQRVLAAAAAAPSTTERAPLPKTTAVVGAGPAGLFASLVLARRGYTNITVFDRLPRPPAPSSSEWGNPLRSYNLGLGARGQIALTEAEVWPAIEPFCAQAIGRKDWTPEAGERPEAIYTDREYKTQVIQRDRLASCILADVEAKHGAQVRVLHDVDCVKVGYPEDGSGQVELTLQERDEDEGTTTFTQRFDWVVGADGVKSAVRGECEDRTSGRRVRAVKLPERNEFVYKTLPLDLRPRYGTGPGWRPDLNYSARIKEEITIEALPTKEGVYIGVVLFRPDNPLIAAIKNKEDARAFFKQYYPQFVELLREEDLEAFATGPTFRLPTFSYAGPELHYKNNTVLMGDTIHAVKPYYGLGCVSALQDAIVLDRCLDEARDDLGKALPLYSKRRGPEAKALVEFQAGFDYDAKTKEGFLRFILPLILDSIFHRLAPRVFAPNGIRLLQDHRYSYTAVRNRKRRDRALQALLIGSVVTGVGRLALWAAKAAARVVLKA